MSIDAVLLFDTDLQIGIHMFSVAPSVFLFGIGLIGFIVGGPRVHDRIGNAGMVVGAGSLFCLPLAGIVSLDTDNYEFVSWLVAAAIGGAVSFLLVKASSLLDKEKSDS